MQCVSGSGTYKKKFRRTGKENEEVFYTNRGYQNLERKSKIGRDTIFRLYSMSKPVTAAGAMILMEQGKLDLAQPVEEILPGFKGLLAEENGVVRPAKKPQNK